MLMHASMEANPRRVSWRMSSSPVHTPVTCHMLGCTIPLASPPSM